MTAVQIGAAAIFRIRFVEELQPHESQCELAVATNVTRRSRSTAGGGELASEKLSGIVAFELLQRTPGPASANLRIGVFGVIAVDHRGRDHAPTFHRHTVDVQDKLAAADVAEASG